MKLEKALEIIKSIGPRPAPIVKIEVPIKVRAPTSPTLLTVKKRVHGLRFVVYDGAVCGHYHKDGAKTMYPSTRLKVCVDCGRVGHSTVKGRYNQKFSWKSAYCNSCFIKVARAWVKQDRIEEAEADIWWEEEQLVRKLEKLVNAFKVIKRLNPDEREGYIARRFTEQDLGQLSQINNAHTKRIENG